MFATAAPSSVLPSTQPRRRLSAWGAAFALFALALGATSAIAHPATASPANTTEWSVSPADAAGPDGRVSLRHVGEPGSSITDAIAVTNLSSAPATFAVVAGDGVLGDNGAFDIATGEPVDAGSWIEVQGTTDGGVALAPGETRVLPVTIAIPAEATPGDHPAGIVVALSQSDDAVTVTNRIGVRLHLQVAGDIVAGVAVDSVTTEFHPSWVPFAAGTLRVHTAVTNEGNVRAGAASQLTVSGPFGLGGAEATGGVDELLPGDSTTITTEVSMWPAFALFGDVSVSVVPVGDDDISAPEPVVSGFTAAAVSWSGLAIVVLLAGIVVAAFILRRRRGTPSEQASEPSGPEEATAREPEVVR